MQRGGLPRQTADPMADLAEKLAVASIREQAPAQDGRQGPNGVQSVKPHGKCNPAKLRHEALANIYRAINLAGLGYQASSTYAYKVHLGFKAAQGLSRWAVDDRTPKELVEALAMVSYAVETIGSDTKSVRASQDALVQVMVGVGGRHLQNLVCEWQKGHVMECLFWAHSVVRKVGERPPCFLD